MYIYLTTNLINGKQYVGKCQRDIIKSKYYIGSGVVLRDAVKKYGKENFKKEVLDTDININNICEREIFWIKEIGCKAPNGYNLTDGGDGLLNVTDEVKKKLSEKRKLLVGELHSNFGMKYSDETKRRMREAQLGKKSSPEHCLNMSKALKGLKRSEETRKNMSEGQMGRIQPMEVILNIRKNQPTCIPVLQLDKKTGEVLGEYISISEAARQTNSYKESISMCLNGKLKSTNGFKWVIKKLKE